MWRHDEAEGFSMAVSQLGYLGIGVTDMAAWLETATAILGVEVRVSDGSSDVRRLRIDAMHHRFSLHPSSKDDVLFAGWQVESLAEMDHLTEAIKDYGLPVTEGSIEECEERKVRRLVKFADPEGYSNELYYGPLYDSAPLKTSLPISGFNAGELGLGHIVRHCKDHKKAVSFYCDVMGFKVSDYIVFADADMAFLRCNNRRHHSLALVNEALGHSAGQTNHFMIEVSSLDDVGRAYDEVLRRKLPIIMTLGRHSNDNTTSFYFVGPSGFGIEIGTGGDLVNDADWFVKTYDSTKLWGHLLPHER